MVSEEFVDQDRIGVYGFSRGAMAAALLSVHPELNLKASILCSGVYDFKSAYDSYSDEGLQGGIKANMRREAGLSPDGPTGGQRP